MNYFRCTVGGSGKGNTVIVTCAEEFAGLTITLSKTGKTYTKTCPSTAPYEVTFYGVENGTYTVSCTVDGQTYSETVVVQDISCVLNYGFSWKLWVDTASQLDSSHYDSLDEVLADEKALRELFLEHACVDYMAESTESNEDLETVINNDLCAKWINLSDYAIDYLHANEVIADLMDEADKYGYGEWALMPQVPAMTSNTAPYGEVSASSVRATGTEAYRAFDGNDSSSYWAATTGTNGWISYKFSNPISVRKVKVFTQNTASLDWQVRYSDDGSSWTNVVGATGTSQASTELFINLNDAGSHLYWSVLNTNAAETSYTTSIYTLQFYAWAPKGNVPVMTSNTAPYGTAAASSANTSSGKEPYNIFSKQGSSKWADRSSAGTDEQRIYYKFTNPVNVRKFYHLRVTSAYAGKKQYLRLQYSDNGSTWYDACENQTSSIINGANINNINVDDNGYHLYWGVMVKVTEANGSGLSWTAYGNELQFYGRELKVSVPTMTSNTAPYGNCIATSLVSSGDYTTYKAFDADTSATLGTATTTSSTAAKYIGYKFLSPVIVSKVIVKTSFTYTANNCVVQGSNDGITWSDDCSTPINLTGDGTIHHIDVDSNGIGYEYWRLYTSGTSSNGTFGLKSLQFYGLDYSEKEFEAGTTKKWLYDHGLELEEITIPTINPTNGSVTRENNQIVVETTSTQVTSGYYVGFRVNQIDLTDFNGMKCIIGDKAVFTNSRCMVMSVDGFTTSTGGVASLLISKIEFPNYLDISSVTGSHGIGFFDNGQPRQAAIAEWWLE